MPRLQVMGMPGMVASVAESLRYITPMAVDVMLFVILRQLASPKKKLKVGDESFACYRLLLLRHRIMSSALPAATQQTNAPYSFVLHPVPQGDGVNLEEWFQWLAAFTGLFCKKQQ